MSFWDKPAPKSSNQSHDANEWREHRDDCIVADRLEGMTLREIADKYSIPGKSMLDPERIRQIVNRKERQRRHFFKKFFE